MKTKSSLARTTRPKTLTGRLRAACTTSLLPLLLLLALPAVAQAQFNYTNNGDGTATITGYTGPGGGVNIPSTIDGLSVTSVGDWAFYNGGRPQSYTLTGVTIPDSVLSIGRYAFAWSGYLRSVTLGNGLVSIGDGAFGDCGLTTITIPRSVTSIGDVAFAYCALSGVYFLGNAPSLGGPSVFQGFGGYPTAYYVSGTTGWGPTFGGCPTALWFPPPPPPDYTYTTNDGTVTITGYTGPGGDVTIPDTIDGLPVTGIGNYAFYQCASLTSVTIPNSVTSVGTNAFDQCTSLTSVTMPNSVTSIADEAFDQCYRLTNITIPTSVTNLGWAAFCDCTSLTSISIPESVTSIADVTFEACYSLASVTIPNSVTNIGSSAFGGCRSLTSVTIPNGVTSIGRFAFEGCTGLSAISVDLLNPAYCSADGVLFNKSQATLIQCPGGKTGLYTIPNTVTNFNDAFRFCAYLTSITIPNSVCTIGDWTFQECLSLTNVTIPNTVTSIGEYAFESCTSLTNITIPARVTTIGDNAFDACTSLADVTIPSSVTNIGSSPFRFCGRLRAITVDAANPAYSSVDGILFNKSETCLIECPGAKSGSYTIPNSVSSIADDAFDSCSSLTNITIPNGVTSIGVYTFYNCPSLISVTIGAGVTNIGYWAFDLCINLTRVYFLGNAPSLAASVFDANANATVYYLPWTIGWGRTCGGRPTVVWQSPPPTVCTLFASTINTTTATLNGTVNPNGYPTTAWFQWGATINYGNLTPATDPGSGITPLPLSAPLAGLTLGITYHFRIAATNENGLIYGSDESFTTSGPPPQVSTLPATGLATNSATLNGTVSPNGWPTTAWFQWGTTTSYGNLTSVTALGSGTTALPLSAPLAGLTPGVTYHFRIAATNDYGLAYGSDQSFTTLGLPLVSTLPATAVSANCATLNATVNPNGWPTTAWFQWGATTSYGYLTSMTTMGSGTTALPLSAPLAGLTLGVTFHFRIAATNDYGLVYGCDQSFTAATSPTEFNYTTSNSMVTITGYSGPGGAVTIPSVINGYPVTRIGNSAFGNCTSLTSITIPSSVTSIGDYAFCGCSSLINVTILDGVTNIGIVAFGQTSLTNVIIPNSVTRVGMQAFYDCENLTNVMIGTGVTNIEYGAFGCLGRLSTISVDVLNPAFSSVAGVLFDKSQTTLLQFPGGQAVSYTLPSSVTGIGSFAFEACFSLTNVTIPNGVTNIGDGAFRWCSNLRGVFFLCKAPSLGGSWVFTGADNATAYYLPGTTGWGTTYGGRPTALWAEVPILLSPPLTQTAEAGSAVRLVVKASSPLPLFYFWYLNATDLLSSGTNWQLSFSKVQLSRSGIYTVVISNVLGMITSAPAMLNVIAAVERRPVPGVKAMGAGGSLLNVDYADSLSRAPTWTPLGSVSLTGTPQYCFDLTLPLPPQRFYRAWQTGTPGVRPSLDLHPVPAITLTGTIGHSVRLDYISQFGPTDAWVTLATVPLTNTSQLYFDISAPGQPPRLYRLVPSP